MKENVFVCPEHQVTAASDDSYGYYKIRGYLPAYLCLGKTHESIQAFLRDTRACGMVTNEFSCVGRNNEYAAFAVDPSPSLNNCDVIALNNAICNFFTEGLTEKLAATYQKGPFPKEREFRICTTWESWGVSHVTAKNARQAASLVIDDDEPLPDDNEYVMALRSWT